MSEWKNLVGKLSDREIARQFGVGASTVRRYRNSQGIAPWVPTLDAPPAELEPLLGVMTDHALSKQFGYPKKHIAELRMAQRIREPKRERGGRYEAYDGIWTDEVIALLGNMPDTDVADLLGTSQFPVRQKRYDLGIPAYKKPMPEISPEIKARFGVVSDAEIARCLGVSANYIRQVRLKYMENR